jgi:hypothetical protein
MNALIVNILILLVIGTIIFYKTKGSMQKQSFGRIDLHPALVLRPSCVPEKSERE